jgi:putative DNA primase/helicase
VVSFRYDLRSGFLELTLPSGRVLSYPAAELFEDEQYDSTSFTFLDASGSKTGRMYHERRGSAFGGLIFENIIQALCRDVFVEAMPRLEASGYRLVMHTHDEYVCEVPDGHGSLEEFLALITQPPSWAPELPIAAKTRISDRLIEIVEPEQAAAVITENIIVNALIRDEEEDDDEQDLEDVEIEPVELPASLMTDPLLVPEPHVYAGTSTGQEKPDQNVQSGQVSAAELPRPPEPPPQPPPSSPSGSGNGHSPHDDLDFSDLLRAGSEPDSEPAASPSGGNGGAYPHGEDPAPGPGAATAEYIYRDARGRLYMRVVRVVQAGKKIFPTSRWDNGSWALGWPDKVVPYRLPELLAAPADTVVLVTEGEKDADTCARFGFVSTTNPGGAGKWQPELAQYFKGRQRICLLEDNDTSGTKNTAAVLRALRDVVPTIGVVRFPELGPGGDVSDYFARGGSKDYLQARIEAALRQGAARDYTLVNLNEVPLEASDWLWEGHLQIGTLELLTGIPGVGKSLVQCNLIATVTTGRDWPNGEPGPRPGQVIILTAEDRVTDCKRRLAAAGADQTKAKILTYIKRNARDELFLLSEDLEKLEQAIHDLGDVSLVTFDPITAFMGHGKGFDSHRVTDVRSQLHPLARLAEKVGVAFSAVTHPPKNAGTRSAIDSFIGSQAFIATARVGHYCISELDAEDDRGRRRPTGRVLFANPKFSHSGPMPTLAYRIETLVVGFDAKRGKDIVAPRIVWEPDPVDITADEAIAANKMTAGDGRKARAAPVREFLRELLASGPVLAKTAIERGAVRGFSIDQLKYARKAVGVAVFKRRGGRS